MNPTNSEQEVSDMMRASKRALRPEKRTHLETGLDVDDSGDGTAIPPPALPSSLRDIRGSVSSSMAPSLPTVTEKSRPALFGSAASRRRIMRRETIPQPGLSDEGESVGRVGRWIGVSVFRSANYLRRKCVLVNCVFPPAG